MILNRMRNNSQQPLEIKPMNIRFKLAVVTAAIALCTNALAAEVNVYSAARRP